MDIRVGRDISSGLTVVALSGALTAAGRHQTRQALMKCVADCPAAVIVNLRDVQMDDGANIAVFAATYEHAMREYGVPVLYAEASPELTARLAPFRSFVHLFPTQSAAVIGLGVWAPRWWSEAMQPVAASVRAARGLVGDACLQWGLTSLRDSAQLIVSELVTNAIKHTGRPFQTTISHSRMYLRIGVKDSSTTLPPPLNGSTMSTPSALADAPRGLGIVRACATHWGSTPMPDGKVVWAALRI